MSIFRNPETTKLRQARRAAEHERQQNMKLAAPLIKSLGRGPVAVVALRGAEQRGKALLAGIKDTFREDSVLQLKAARVQRVDPEGTYVDETIEKLRDFRRRSELIRGGSLVIFTGTKFPQPDTIDDIGRGTPEVIEHVTGMMEAHGPNDPWFMFIGKGRPEDLPSDLGFPRELNRGILDAVDITYGLHATHGLTTVLPSQAETSMVVGPFPDQERKPRPLE